MRLQPFFLFPFADVLNQLKYLEILPISNAILCSIINWELTPLSFVVIIIQPPPLCGPTNIINSSVMACLERNGNIIYNISIHHRTCYHNITSSFYLDCPLMLSNPVVKFRSYSIGTMIALSSTSEIIVCLMMSGQN